MGGANLAQEKRIMLFEEVCGAWTERRLTQEAAAELLEEQGFERIVARRDLAAHPRLTLARKPLRAIGPGQKSCVR